MMEATVFLGTFNAAEMFWYPSPDLPKYVQSIEFTAGGLQVAETSQG
jgi:hypothetical protein